MSEVSDGPKRTFELKDLILTGLATLSLGGFTGSKVLGAGGQAAETAKEIAVLSAQMEAQNRLAAERDEAQAKRIAELSAAMDSLKALVQNGTNDRYPRAQAVSDLSTLRDEIREVRSRLQVHSALQGHPQALAAADELRRRVKLLEEEVKQLTRDLNKISSSKRE